jgi:hypothetical protein
LGDLRWLSLHFGQLEMRSSPILVLYHELHGVTPRLPLRDEPCWPASLGKVAIRVAPAPPQGPRGCGLNLNNIHVPDHTCSVTTNDLLFRKYLLLRKDKKSCAAVTAR